MDFKVAAVLPAGGTGVRMGHLLPKQFLTAKGKPVIYYSMKAFDSVPWIQHIIVPVQDEFAEHVNEVCKEHNFQKIQSCKAGHTRFYSIYEGIKYLEENLMKPDVVVICDAARPFMDFEALTRVTKAARDYGAAGVTRPLVSTVLCPTEDGFLDHSLDRTRHVASEMPQAFQFDLIKQGFMKASSYDFEHGTECLHIAQRHAGATVKLIPGGDMLWKVTYKRDLAVMEHLLNEKEGRPAVAMEGGWDHFPNVEFVEKQLSEAMFEDNQALISTGENIESKARWFSYGKILHPTDQVDKLEHLITTASTMRASKKTWRVPENTRCLNVKRASTRNNNDINVSTAINTHWQVLHAKSLPNKGSLAEDHAPRFCLLKFLDENLDKMTQLKSDIGDTGKARPIAVVYVCVATTSETKHDEARLRKLISSLNQEARIGVIIAQTIEANLKRLVSLVKSIFASDPTFLNGQVLIF